MSYLTNRDHFFNRAFLALCLFLSSIVAIAETEKAVGTAAVVTAKSPVVVPSVGLASSMTVLLSLLLVVALIFTLAWFMKRLGVANVSHHSAMKVLATMPLSNKDKLTIVEVGDTQILLGVSPGRINKLHVFEEKVLTVDEDARPVFKQFLNAAQKNKSQQGENSHD